MSSQKLPQDLIKNEENISFYQECSSFIPGKLRKQIDGAVKKNESVNFLNFFAELNLAALLHSRGINFEYESMNGVDFVFDDYALDFKNLNEKGYRQDEKNELREMLAKSSEGKVKMSKEYSNTKVVLELGRDGSSKRYESGSVMYGHPPDSEMREKRKILERMAGLEGVSTSKKKVLFFCGQSDEIDSGYIGDCCRYYFDFSRSGGDPASETNYKSWFGRPKDNSINAVIYAEPKVGGVSSLVWYSGASLEVWTKDKNTGKFFKGLFIR